MEEQEIKMLEQPSAVQQAQQDLRELEKENVVDLTNDNDEQVVEKMKDFEDAVITADQLKQLRAMYFQKPKQLVRKHAKIGRNDLCICGSGKKYKNCCMGKEDFDGLIEIDS